jgi:hypothetical protein
MPSIVGFYSADIKFFIKPKKIKESKKWKKIPENGKANFFEFFFVNHLLLDHIKSK